MLLENLPLISENKLGGRPNSILKNPNSITELYDHYNTPSMRTSKVKTTKETFEVLMKISLMSK